MHSRIAIGLLAGSVLIVSTSISGRRALGLEPIDSKRQAASAVARVEITLAEKQLERLLELQPAIAERRIGEARIELAEARIRLAKVENRLDTIVKNLDAITAIRQRQLNHTVKLAAKQNVIAIAKVDEFRVDLAESRIRLALHTILAARQRQLDRVMKLGEQGRVPRRSIERARKELAQARDRLAASSR